MSDDSPTRSLAVGADATRPLTPEESAAPAPAAPPRRVGEIELLRELGRGGMGTVWLGHDTLLGRDVAVKFLLNAPASRDDPHFAGFVRSAELAAQVKSPRLTEIYSAGVSDGVPYLVMEYSPGVALSSLLQRRGAFGVPLTLAVMEAVCEGAADLHEHGVVHGDFKPSNVLVEPDGRIVVTDFGLAVARPREQVGGSSQGCGGTPAYMAPELFEGKATYQTDAYALGIMLYELLAGAPPFEGSFAELAERHRGDGVPIERLPGSVPAGLRELVARATEKSPRLRSKSGRHLLDALRRSVPDPRVWERGRAELAALLKTSDHPDAKANSASSGVPSSSYYDALHALSSSHAMARLGSNDSRAEEMPASLSTVDPPVVPRIVRPLACLACTYDLRGLEPGAQCPECGTPVSETLDPERLIFAHKGWKNQLYFGLALAIVFLWPIGAIVAARRDPGARSAPARPGSRWVETARITARWCGALYLALMAVSVASLIAFTAIKPALLSVAFWVLMVVYSSAWAVWTGELARRGRQVSRRRAGRQGAAARVLMSRRRGPLVPLRNHLILLGVVTIGFGVFLVFRAKGNAPLQDVAVAVMSASAVTALVASWLRTGLAGTPLAEARKHHTERATLIGSRDAAPVVESGPAQRGPKPR